MTPFIQEPAHKMLVPQLSDLIDAKYEDLPQFHLLHPLTSQVVAFPDKLDEAANFTPDLLLAWVHRTVLYFELETLISTKAKMESETPEEGMEG